jgi:choline/glycine/proline betaine transport protein
MFAIALSITHYGLSGWVEYFIIASAMSLAQWRFKLPASFRLVFYPILGDYMFGWIGDAIDSITILVTIAGICLMLGQASAHLVYGLSFIGWVDDKISHD